MVLYLLKHLLKQSPSLSKLLECQMVKQFLRQLQIMLKVLLMRSTVIRQGLPIRVQRQPQILLGKLMDKVIA